jgi:hypothetical protein
MQILGIKFYPSAIQKLFSFNESNFLNHLKEILVFVWFAVV